MASTWSQGQWNLGTWNNAVSGASISGIQINASAGSFAFNLGNGAVFTPTGLSAGIDVNLGNGWSREEWNAGAWNLPIGSIVAGSGTIFIEDSQALNASANSISITAAAPFSITGEELTSTLGEEIATAGSSNVITGEEVVTAQIDSFAVAAGGAITINTPTFEANVELSTGAVVGTANFIDIDGFNLTLNLGDLFLITNNIISVTGRQLTTTANNISIVAEHFQTIIGQELNISQATIIPTSENFLSITGFQANTDVSTLKFWDPILPTNTETWTNIH